MKISLLNSFLEPIYASFLPNYWQDHELRQPLINYVQKNSYFISKILYRHIDWSNGVNIPRKGIFR